MFPGNMYNPRIWTEIYIVGKVGKAFNARTHKYITNKKLECYETFFAITSHK